MLSLRYAIKSFDMDLVSSAEALYYKNDNGKDIYSVEFSKEDAAAMPIVTKMNSLLFQAMEKVRLEKDERYVQSTVSHDISDSFLEDLCVVHWPVSSNSKQYAAKGDPDKVLTGEELRRLMFKEGFEIDEKTHMVPLLSGAGMARNAKFLFCAEKYRDRVLEIISNGLMKGGNRFELPDELPDKKNPGEFIKTTISPAKIMAYIGLSDSDGMSIEELGHIWKTERPGEPDPSENITIGEETVVVVPDVYGELMKGGYKYTVENYKRTVYGKEEKKETDDIRIRELKSDEKANLTDGYGFISPEWSSALNQLRKCRRPENIDHKAFIIRMSFVKGVVIECDFKKYLKEHGVTEITDIDNRKVELDKVQMILTESMFKAYKLFKKKAEQEAYGKSSWQIWCKNFKENGLSPVIVGSDSNASTMSRLNYQFISSLQPDKEAMKSCVAADLFRQKERLGLLVGRKVDETQADYAKRVAEYLRPEPKEEVDKGDDIELENMNVGSDEEDEEKGKTPAPPVITDDDRSENGEIAGLANAAAASSNAEDEETSYGDLLARIVKAFPDVANTRLVKEEMAALTVRAASDVSQGRPLVKAQTRLLCGDPFALLNSLIKGEENTTPIAMTCIANEGRVYAPGVDADKFLILRNPHVSAFEVALVDNMRTDKDAISKRYEEYFGNHKGLVFIGPAIASMLGGADFDGDRAKLVFDNALIKLAEKNNAKIMELLKGGKEGFKVKEDETTTKIPFVSINPYTVNNIPVEEMNEDMWEKMFVSHEKSIDSNVGRLSISAATLSLNYGMFSGIKTVEDVEEKKAAEAAAREVLRLLARQTTIIGLDIDAAKSGTPPEIQEICDKGSRCPVLKFSRSYKKYDGSHMNALDKYMAARDKAMKEDDSKKNISTRKKYLTGTPAGRELVSLFDLKKHEALLRKWMPLKRRAAWRVKNDKSQSFTAMITEGLAPGISSDMEKALNEAKEKLKASAGRASQLKKASDMTRYIISDLTDLMGYLLSRYTHGQAFRFKRQIVDGKRPVKTLKLDEDSDLMEHAFCTNAERKFKLREAIFGKDCAEDCDTGFIYDASAIQLARIVQKYRKSCEDREKAFAKLQKLKAAPQTTGAQKKAMEEIADKNNVKMWDMGRILLRDDVLTEMMFVLLFGSFCPGVAEEEKKGGVLNA